MYYDCLLHVIITAVVCFRLFAVADSVAAWQWSGRRRSVWKYARLCSSEGARRAGTAQHSDIEPGQPAQSARGTGSAAAGADEGILRLTGYQQ